MQSNMLKAPEHIKPITTIFATLTLTLLLSACGGGGGGGSTLGDEPPDRETDPEQPSSLDPLTPQTVFDLSQRSPLGWAYRINVGGEAFTDSDGNDWLEDQFSNGFGESQDSGEAVEILNTENDRIYQTQRFDRRFGANLIYRIPVISGSYQVNIHLAETYEGTSEVGARVFDVLVEDQLLGNDIDIFSLAGGSNRALIETYDNVQVTDGQLKIEFQHEVENPSIAGIEIIYQGNGLSEDFSSADLSQWSFVDDSLNPSDWQVSNGRLVQLSDVAEKKTGTAPVVQSFAQGSYGFLTHLPELADYRLQVEMTPTPDEPDRDTFDSQEAGIMFRYRDNDNYYRLSLSGANSYFRLEKKVAGNFQSLATSGRGYVEGQTYSLEVLVAGNLIRVSIDDKPIISLLDDSLATGIFALYGQDSLAFDNLELTGLPVHPVVSLGSPMAFSVSPGNTVTATATVLNAQANHRVFFRFADSDCEAAVESPAGSGQFTANCGTFPTGTYSLPGQGLVALLYDDQDTYLGRDEHQGIGLGGDFYLSVGNSITLGSFDLSAHDNRSADGRILGVQGYQARLNDLLTAASGLPHMVANAGIGRETLESYRQQRLNTVLQRYPTANKALVMLGTNNANNNGGISVSQFQNQYQTLVNTLANDGKTVFAAKIPPFLPFENFSVKNDRAIAFNLTLDSLSNLTLGPDFFNFFYDDGGTPGDSSDDYDRFSLYEDNIHPNGLGQSVIATLWYNHLTGDSRAPFILDRLCNRLESSDCSATSPTSHKQDFLATNYPTYYVDETFEIVESPDRLDDGIWIKTLNSETNNSAADYLYFEVDRPVEVIVAYDAGAAALPNWLTQSFSATGEAIFTSDPATSQLDLYSASFPAGSVELGGNLAPGAAGAKANYVVIVVE